MNLKSRSPGPICRAERFYRALPLGLLLLLLAATPLPAQSHHYLASGRPDGVALLAPPPASGSAEEAADLASARAVFQARTPAEKDRAFKDSTLSIFLFEPAIGPFFKPGKFPKTEALFLKVKTDIAEAIDTPKAHWKRQRPYQMDESLSLGGARKKPQLPERAFDPGHSSSLAAGGTIPGPEGGHP